MSWDKWIPKKYLVKSEICGVEVNFNEDGIIYYFTLLKNKGKKLEIAETGSCKEVLSLPKIIEKNKIPLVIIINGKGIIIKKVSLEENKTPNLEELIRENLPAINSTEFFIQFYKSGSNSGFINLVRKEIVNKVLDEVKGKKFTIAEVLIGSPSIIGMEPLWKNFNNLSTSSQIVELTNGEIDSIINGSHSKETIKIEELTFSPDHTLGFAGGLSYLMQRTIAQNKDTELDLFYQSHINNNKLKFSMVLVVGIAFLLSAINVMFYTNFFDTNNKLETELSVYQGKYDQINKLLDDYQKKKSLIENAGVLSKNKLSEFADKIGQTIPDEVVLTEMYFNPKIDNEDSEDSMVVFQNKQLIIKGNCNKSLIINEWVNVLKMQKFIKDVSLEKFAYNNEGFLPNYEIRLITE